MFFKKKKIKVDKNLDKDLDFDLEFDLDDSLGDNSDTKKRSAVTKLFKGALKGAKNTITNPREISKIILKNMPDEIGDTVDFYGDISNSVVDEYKKSITQLRPHLRQMSNQIDRMVPEEKKRIKGITSKLNKFISGDDDSYSGEDPARSRDEGLTSDLAAIFKNQQDNNVEIQARIQAKEKVKDHIEGVRFSNQQALLSSINNAVVGLNSYNQKVNSAYQRKSLELQYRSYFVQSDMLKTVSESNKVMIEQLSGILKNTGLPDYVKLTETERWASISKNSLIKNLNNKLFSKGGYLEAVKSRISNKIQNVTNSIADGSGMMGLFMDQMEDMLSGDGQDVYDALGGAAGGAATSYGLNRMVKKGANKYLKKGSKGRNFINRTALAMTNPGALVNKLRQSDFIQDGEFTGNVFTSKLSMLASGLLDIFDPVLADNKVKDKYSAGNLSKPALYDNMARTSIVKIIPGYLSRILKENMYASNFFKTYADSKGLKINTPELLIYSHRSDKFEGASSFSKSILKTLDQHANSENVAKGIDSSIDLLTTGVSYKKNMKDLKKNVSKLLTAIATNLGKITDPDKKDIVKDYKVEYRSLREELNKEDIDSYEIERVSRSVSQLANNVKSLLSSTNLSVSSEFATQHQGVDLGLSRAEKGKKSPLNDSSRKLEQSMAREALTLASIDPRLSNDPREIFSNSTIAKIVKDKYKNQLDQYGNPYGDAGVNKAWASLKAYANKVSSDSDLALTWGNNFSSVREAHTDSRGVLEELMDSSPEAYQMLRDIGQIDREKDGSLSRGKYSLLDGVMRAFSGIATSDYHAKGNIKPYSGVLNKLSKLPSYSWNYKEGEGDGGAHIGPMAQDTYKLFGDKAAPGGKSIDLVTLNGLTMQGVKELNVDQKTLSSMIGSKLESIKNILGNTFKLSVATSKLSVSQIKNLTKDKYEDVKSSILDVYDTKINPAMMMGKDKATKAYTKTKDKMLSIKDAFAEALGEDFKELPFKQKLKRINSARRKLVPEYFGELKVTTSDIASAQKQYLKEKFPETYKHTEKLFNLSAKGFGVLSDNAKKLAEKVASNGKVVAAKQKLTGLAEQFKDTEYGGALVAYAKDAVDGATEEIRRDGLLNFVSALSYNKAKEAKEGAKGYGQKLLAIGKSQVLNRCLVDVYVMVENAEGKLELSKEPLLKSSMFSAGAYHDRFGNVIESPCKIKGGVYTAAGKMLLDKEQLRNGLYDHTGKKITTVYGMFGLGKKGFKGVMKGVWGVLTGAGKARRKLRTAWHRDKGIQELRAMLPNWLDKTITGTIDLNDKMHNKIFGKKKKIGNKSEPSLDGETPEPPADATKEERKHWWGVFKRKKKFNDGNGDGERDGSWMSMLKDKKGKLKDKIHNKLKINKEDSGFMKLGKFLLGGMGLLFGGLKSVISGGFKALLELGKHLIPMIAGKAASGLGGLLGKFGKSKTGKFLGRVTRGGLVGAGLAIAAPFVADAMDRKENELNPSGNPDNEDFMRKGVRNTVGLVADHPFLTGLAVTYAPALLPMLSQPWLYVPLLIAGAGYLAFKGYQYYKNSKFMKEITDFRMAQYGLNPYVEANSDKKNKIANLEYYFIDKTLMKSNGNYIVNPGLVKPETVFKILGLKDPSDALKKRLTKYIIERFIPVLNYNIATYLSVNNKLSILDIDKDTEVNKYKFIKAAEFPNGPYSVMVSPFQDVDMLDANKTVVSNVYSGVVNVIFSKVKDQLDKTKVKDVKDIENFYGGANPDINKTKLDKGLGRPPTAAEQTKANYKTINGVTQKSKNTSVLSGIDSSFGGINNKLGSGPTGPGGANALSDLSGVSALKLNASKGEVKAKIAELSKKYGFDPALMETIAAMESGFEPMAKPGTSSASGTFQFISSTWAAMTNKYGKKFGITPATAREGIEPSLIMAGLFAAENMKTISKVVPNPTVVDIYGAHFMGAGGWLGFKNYMNSNPDAIAATYFPKQARANPGVFGGGGYGPYRTFRQVYDYLANRIQKTAIQYGTGLNVNDTYSVKGSGSNMTIVSNGKGQSNDTKVAGTDLSTGAPSKFGAATGKIDVSSIPNIGNSSNIKESTSKPKDAQVANFASDSKPASVKGVDTTPVSNVTNIMDTDKLHGGVKEQTEVIKEGVTIQQKLLKAQEDNTKVIAEFLRTTAENSKNVPRPPASPVMGMQRGS